MAFEIACGSHPGMTRPYNDDNAMALSLTRAGQEPLSELLLAVVADGMGGHSNGAIASSSAVRALAAGLMAGLQTAPLEGLAACAPEQVVALVEEAVAGAGQRVNQGAQYGLSDMGTTLVCALFMGERALIANVGDSRCYLLDQHGLHQITEDHSLVQRLVSAGEITEEEARVHPRRNEIYNMLGLGQEPRPDFFWLDLRPGDTLLLCSDGLNTMLPDERIAQVLRSAPTLSEALDGLIAAANRAGGEDNVSAVLVRVLQQEGGAR